jgi:Ni2+-binding GTPase involved in maturation of urease and hydrogenase
MPAIRYIMIGGFLGAGKTTAVARLAQTLRAKNLRVGLITNDQGRNMVDTAMLRLRGFPTEEIPGGCFCCRFNSLVDAANKLTESVAPDVFIAEPVGSCTDLIATVSYPLRRMYGEQFAVAPLSVLLDPIRALRIFNVEEGGNFSEKVRYIYLKQMEEADLVVINKVETLTFERLVTLRSAISLKFPAKDVLAVSARTGLGLPEWFEKLQAGSASAGEAMAINYDTYAEGEALMGWLNCTVHISGETAWDGNEVLRHLAEAIHRRLCAAKGEIAHLKMTLSPDGGLGGIGVVNLVRNDYVPELALELAANILSGELIINARVEMPPEQIFESVSAGLAEISARHHGLTFRIRHEEHFRPGKPQPTHRLKTLLAPRL